MKIEFSSLKSRVARRLFGMFFFVLLVPIALISIGSFYKVSDIVLTEHQQNLQRAAKEYGLGIFRRLNYANDLLTNTSQHAVDLNQFRPEYMHLLLTYFSGYAVTQDQKIIWQESIDNLTVDWLEILEQAPKNKGVFTMDNYDGHTKQVFISLILNDVQWIAKLNETYLWPDAELNAFEELCVVAADSQVIYCSSPLTDDAVARLQQTPSKAVVKWQNADFENMISVSWSLFMRYQFYDDDWKVIISKPENIFLQSIVMFKWSVLPAILLIFLLVVFISLYMVRRHLRPVEQLIKGTKALSQKKVYFKVEVDSDDEYEDLAESFNHMADSLTREFEYNEALLNINKIILLNEDLSSFAKSVLAEINRFSYPSFSLLYVINKNRYVIDRIYKYEYASHFFKEIKHPPEDMLDALFPFLGKSAKMFTEDEAKAIPIGQTWTIGGCLHYYPIYEDGHLNAFLFINLTEVQINDRFSDFLSHCTVAFNALQRGKLLKYQASYDRLTGLYNRTFLQDQAKNALSSTDKLSFALLFIDLDRFKNINDTLGHSFGDQLLQLVARRLMENLPERSFLCRFGGDEFILLLSINTCSYAEVVAQHWIDLLSSHFELQGRRVNIGASIGIALAPNHSQDFEGLLTCADMAMYEAKSHGRNRYCVYSDSLHNELTRRTKLESFLRSVEINDCLSVHYQPKINIQNHQFSGYEALARFNHPIEGFISPDIMFQIAEESGQVHRIGLTVMEIALEQLKEWLNLNIWKGRMAINVSPLQLESVDFIPQVQGLLKKIDISPQFIEFEVTEGVFIQSNDEVRRSLQYFQDMGISIAMDDFGTGYSSMAYITDLPLNNIKIDKAFISNIEKNNKSSGIIKSMIQIGKNIGLTVTAEGVETQEELDFLIHNSCDDIQGYLYSKPLTANNAKALLVNPDLDHFFKR